MMLEAKNLSFARAKRYLFRNLNIKLSAGELLCIQGQNGSGKTTLLKLLAGLMDADKGVVSWKQQAIAQSDDYHQQLAYLGHKDGLKLALSGQENIQAQLALSNTRQTQENISAVCECFGLTNHIALPCAKLSAGLKRKVALSALILKQKPLWIVDEPYTALDKHSIETFTYLMTQHLANKGMVIIVSHLAVPYAEQKTLHLSDEVVEV